MNRISLRQRVALLTLSQAGTFAQSAKPPTARHRHHRCRHADGHQGAHRWRRSTDQGRRHGQVQRQRRRAAPRPDEARRAGGCHQSRARDRGLLHRLGLGDAADGRCRGRREAASRGRRDREDRGRPQQPGSLQAGGADAQGQHRRHRSSSRPASFTASPTSPITSSTCRSGRIPITCLPAGYVHPLLKK